MKVVALISGGKDSCYNMMQCIADGHEIVALANLQPVEKDEIDSYMYQSVGHDVLPLYAQAMQLPLFRQEIVGKPVNKEFNYEYTEGDEVEDLCSLLHKVKDSMDVEAVSVGAIFSDYQRVRVQNVCDRLNLKMLAYLWHRDQKELLQEMINCQIKAVIIKVASLGLDPKKHLGQTLEELYPHLIEMNTKYGLNICGEGGEFETLTLDCPLFKKQLVMVNYQATMFTFENRDFLKSTQIEILLALSFGTNKILFGIYTNCMPYGGSHRVELDAAANPFIILPG